jgi:hypothetical protein
MAQYYKLLQFKAGDFQDRNGNYWCTARFEGQGEPVAWVMKAETVQKITESESYYGEIRDYTSAKGKLMPRFYKEQEPEQVATPAQSGQTNIQKKEWQPREDHHEEIKAQWAIGQAVQMRNCLKESALVPNDYIETEAKKLYAMVDRVKGEHLNLIDELSPEEIQARAEAARDAQRIKDTVRDDIIETTDEPINLDDIPF